LHNLNRRGSVHKIEVEKTHNPAFNCTHSMLSHSQPNQARVLLSYSFEALAHDFPSRGMRAKESSEVGKGATDTLGSDLRAQFHRLGWLSGGIAHRDREANQQLVHVCARA